MKDTSQCKGHPRGPSVAVVWEAGGGENHAAKTGSGKHAWELVRDFGHRGREGAEREACQMGVGRNEGTTSEDTGDPETGRESSQMGAKGQLRVGTEGQVPKEQDQPSRTCADPHWEPPSEKGPQRGGRKKVGPGGEPAAWAAKKV